jgi:hypothetical protein
MRSPPQRVVKSVKNLVRAVRRRAKWLIRRPSRNAEIKLHLGCGPEYLEGYINIDTSCSANSDLRLNFTRIEEHFNPGTVSEVVMIHSLSYLRLWQARDLFASICRLLKRSGQLVIELPDLGKCAQKVLAKQGDVGEYLEAVRGLYAFDLDQIKNKELFTPYAFGWSGWHLRLELERAGFTRTELQDPLTHGKRLDRDVRVIATK